MSRAMLTKIQEATEGVEVKLKSKRGKIFNSANKQFEKK